MTKRYAGLIKNDVVDCDDGLCVSFWTQGCPFHCKGCHNPQTWDFAGGEELPLDYVEQICQLLTAHGITRHLSILGGEPLCEPNIDIVYPLVTKVKATLPGVKIYLWTGYILTELKKRANPSLNAILDCVDVLIDGPYDETQRDLSLPLRGSKNQKIYRKKHGIFVADN